MTETEASALAEVSRSLAAAQKQLDQVMNGRDAAWTLDDLRREVDRWERELRATTNSAGQHYPADTISTHIGHSRQFIRWLAGEWQPTGPRIRP
jgi:hypothetical protein